MNSSLDKSFSQINKYLNKFSKTHPNWKTMPGLREALVTIMELTTDIEEYTYSLPISTEKGQLIPIDIRTGEINSEKGDTVYLDLQNNYIFSLEENNIYSYIGYWDDDTNKVIYDNCLKKKKNINYENIAY